MGIVIMRVCYDTHFRIERVPDAFGNSRVVNEISLYVQQT